MSRGAVSIVVVVASALVLAAGYAADVAGNLLVSAHRAQSAADGAAHAAVAELIRDPEHDAISRLVERDAAACWFAAAPADARAGAGLDDRCVPAVLAARTVVDATRGARLLSLTVVADPRDNVAMSDVPGRLEALAMVAVPRGLTLPGRTCDAPPEAPAGTAAPGLCFAVATSAAQEA